MAFHLVVFALALLSFARLLGQFYGLWTMHVFGCWVLPPATALLTVIAYRHRDEGEGGQAAEVKRGVRRGREQV